MRFSSITIANGKSYEFEHLDRTQGTLHSIFDLKEMNIILTAKPLKKFIKRIFKEKKLYGKRKIKEVFLKPL
jgi:hypothetical protein